MKNAILSTLALGLLVGPVASQAAYITIDDSALDTVTISAGDFEAGFYVNGTLLASGLHSHGSITLADGLLHSFYGTWIDLGYTTTGDTDRYFGIGSQVYSGVESGASTNGQYGTIEGLFVGFDWANSFGPSAATMPQDGSLADFSRPYLSATFISEVVAVPEPSTLALFGLGLLGLGLCKWRKLN